MRTCERSPAKRNLFEASFLSFGAMFPRSQDVSPAFVSFYSVLRLSMYERSCDPDQLGLLPDPRKIGREVFAKHHIGVFDSPVEGRRPFLAPASDYEIEIIFFSVCPQGQAIPPLRPSAFFRARVSWSSARVLMAAFEVLVPFPVINDPAFPVSLTNTGLYLLQGGIPSQKGK